MQTTVSLPKNLVNEISKQVEEGKFSSNAEFIRSAVKTYLLFQKGKLSWDVLAVPFRAYAKEKKLTEKDILKVVEKGRYVKTFTTRK